MTLNAKGTSTLRGHPKGGLPYNGNFPLVKIANHARVCSNKIAILFEKNGAAMDEDPRKSSDNKGFYTSEVKSISRTHKNTIEPKQGVRFQDHESDTHKVRPRTGRVARKNAGLVLTASSQHHRSVLGPVAPRVYEGRSTDVGRSVQLAIHVNGWRTVT